jgi:hypothetical protein
VTTVATRADFQALIDWCTEPHPADHPRLTRGVEARLTKRFGNFEFWNGIFDYSPWKSRIFNGDFYGSLISSFYLNPPLHVLIGVSLGDNEVLAGIQGQDLPWWNEIGREWSEDVSVEIVSRSADGTIIFASLGPEDSGFDVLLSRTYHYGG